MIIVMFSVLDTYVISYVSCCWKVSTIIWMWLVVYLRCLLISTVSETPDNTSSCIFLSLLGEPFVQVLLKDLLDGWNGELQLYVD